MLPLTAADLLAKVIVGSALEHMDLDRLIQQIGPEVAARIHTGQESVDDVAVALHKALQFQSVSDLRYRRATLLIVTSSVGTRVQSSSSLTIST